MARSRRALTLTTAFVAVVVARAAGQPVLPAPASLPGPAAVLLPPVLSEPSSDRIVPVRSDSDLPVAQPYRDFPTEPEPAARIRFRDSEVVTVRGVEYERSRQTSTSFAEPSSDREIDPFEYLMERPRSPRTARKDDEFLPRLRDRDDRSFGEKLSDRIHDLLGLGGGGKGRRGLFESDRAFDHFISPLSNPFYFEDPRSVSELRGLALFQKIPDAEALFRGGNTMFFGGQARLAISERWSVVLNKVGVQLFRPGRGSTLSNATGLSELWIGPKVVIIRDPEFQTLLSAGATFQIPLGSDQVYQNTGRLSIVPYVTAAQKLMSTAWGTLNGMATGGYSFGTNRDRSDFFYASAHLDFDIGNQHRFYPLAELNWFSYTTDGQARSSGPVGRDLANFGGPSNRNNLVTWALGGRYKSASSRWEFGAAIEGPFLGPRDLFRYRFLVDLIWRY
jgi:hypothetical protein